MSKQNLLSEGVKQETIFVTGNTVIDALLWVNKKLKLLKIETQILQQLEKEGITRK